MGLGIAALALGVLAIPFALIPCIGVYSMPVSGLGLFFGIVGLVVAVVAKRGGTGFPIAGSAVSLAALAVAGLWFLICAGMMTGVKKAGDEFAKQLEEQQRQGAASWVDASKDAATHGDVRIRVRSVTLGHVEMEDARGGLLEAPGEYLLIRLAIENQSPTVGIEYKGWAGRPHFGLEAVVLKDRLFSNYLQATFARPVKGQVHKPQRIDPTQSLEELLVFIAPMNNPDELRLELPASTLERTGKIKLRIPASMIKR
jgi:hypothetical protein